MKLYFLAVLIFLTAVDGIIISLILLLFPNKNNYSKRLLGISLLCYSWNCVILAAVYSGVILMIPHIFRTGSPLMYLVAPASYLYVRSSLSGETKPRKYDWVHLIPFVFLAIELVPFYMKSSAYKIQAFNYYLIYKENLTYLNEGFFNERFHFVFRFALAIIYVCLQWRVISRFMAETPLKLKVKYMALIKWLKLYTLLVTVIFSFIIIFCIFNLYFKTLGEIPNMMIAAYPVIVSLVLIFNPGVLYSLNEEFVFVQVEKPIETPEKQDKLYSRKCSVDDLLLNQKRYLVRGYSLTTMAAELEMSVPALSAIINNEYQLSFSDLINKHRIEHIIRTIDDQKIAALTFEAIATEAGFNSRTTFYRAFIKVTGQTPTAYFKKK